jgi:hypothetical protein
MEPSAALTHIPCDVGPEREIAVMEKIVSGGQTGVDRAALRFGLDVGLEVGGYCPAGFRAEDGVIPSRFQPYLVCTERPDYRERTRRNVASADATLIVGRGELAAGTALTRTWCRRLGKPLVVVQIGEDDASDAVASWLQSHSPSVLNVAGPRESTHPGIEAQAYDLLVAVFELLRTS